MTAMTAMMHMANVGACCHADTPPWGEGHADFLSALTALQLLDLARTYMVSPHLEVLGKLHNLRELDLSHTAIESSVLQTVSPALTGLQRLDVSYTPVVGAQSASRSCALRLLWL